MQNALKIMQTALVFLHFTFQIDENLEEFNTSKSQIIWLKPVGAIQSVSQAWHRMHLIVSEMFSAVCVLILDVVS